MIAVQGEGKKPKRGKGKRLALVGSVLYLKGKKNRSLGESPSLLGSLRVSYHERTPPHQIAARDFPRRPVRVFYLSAENLKER